MSLVIPSYNSASILPHAIDSAMRQTRPPDAIFVVDDGSSDDTATVCQRYAPQVTLIRQHNAGASTARNTGIQAAVRAFERQFGGRGTAGVNHWLAFLDADDEWLPDKLERQLHALAGIHADFCVTAAMVWSPRERRHVRYAWDGPADAHILKRQLLVRNVLTGLCSSLLVRQEALLAVGGFAAGKAAEDRRIAIELLDRHRPLILREPLIRQRPGPAHWTDPERHRREMLRLIDDYAAAYRTLSPTGLLRRRALGRVHERSGMHYLENGDRRAAARDLWRAVCWWPFMANPWRVLVNACLGRLSNRPSHADTTGRTLPA